MRRTSWSSSRLDSITILVIFFLNNGSRSIRRQRLHQRHQLPIKPSGQWIGVAILGRSPSVSVTTTVQRHKSSKLVWWARWSPVDASSTTGPVGAQSVLRWIWHAGELRILFPFGYTDKKSRLHLLQLLNPSVKSYRSDHVWCPTGSDELFSRHGLGADETERKISHRHEWIYFLSLC